MAARRKPLREIYAANNAADKFYAAMAGVAPQNQVAINPKRIITQRMADEDREEAVMVEVGDAIRLSASVLLAWRQNSGSLTDDRGVPIWFYRKVKGMDDMTISDYVCGTPRETAQDAFIQAIRSSGGVGGFVTCAEQALEILK